MNYWINKLINEWMNKRTNERQGRDVVLLWNLNAETGNPVPKSGDSDL